MGHDGPRTSMPGAVPDASRGREGRDDGGSPRRNARAPDGARAAGHLQARAAIASTSFHRGKRPVAFFEYTSSPSRVISNTPPELFTSSTSASSTWENLSLTRSASGSYPQAPQYSILNFIEVSPAMPPVQARENTSGPLRELPRRHVGWRSDCAAGQSDPRSCRRIEDRRRRNASAAVLGPGRVGMGRDGLGQKRPKRAGAARVPEPRRGRRGRANPCW